MLRSLRVDIDTSNATGRIGAAELGSWGGSPARQLGMRGGPGARRSVDLKALNASKAALAQRVYASAESPITIAATLKVRRATVYRVHAV